MMNRMFDNDGNLITLTYEEIKMLKIIDRLMDEDSEHLHITGDKLYSAFAGKSVLYSATEEELQFVKEVVDKLRHTYATVSWRMGECGCPFQEYKLYGALLLAKVLIVYDEAGQIKDLEYVFLGRPSPFVEPKLDFDFA